MTAFGVRFGSKADATLMAALGGKLPLERAARFRALGPTNLRWQVTSADYSDQHPFAQFWPDSDRETKTAVGAFRDCDRIF